MSAQWSIRQHSEELLDGLLHSSRLPLNAEVLNPTHRAKIEGDGSDPPIPTPFFATEGIVAIKALEGTCASALAQCRFGEPANASIDVFKAVPSLFVHNVSEVEGLGLFKFGRANEGSPATEKLTKADFNKVFVNEYRHSINGMYSTKDDRIMHLHGSLNSTPTLRSLGLPPFIDGMREAEAIQLIQSKAIAYTAAELQQQAIDNKTAGQTVLTQGVSSSLGLVRKLTAFNRSLRRPSTASTSEANRFGSKRPWRHRRLRYSSRPARTCWPASKSST
jgi:hypothetical protein